MTPTTPPEQTGSAVAIRPQSSGIAELDNWPADRFNRLVPTAYVQQVNPFLVPVVAAVELDIERDTYHLPDMKDGERALGKTGLQKLSNVAGASLVDQWRSDNGTEPDVVEYTSRVALPLPTGQVIYAMGIKRTDARKERFNSPAHEARWRKDQAAMTATKSHLRGLRAILTLQTTYSTNELRRPWAVVHYAPNMAEPEVRAAMLAGMAGSAAQLYGGGSVRDQDRPKVIEAPAAPDDDGPGPQGSVTTPGGTVIDSATGQVDAGSPLFDGVKVPLADRLAIRAQRAESGKEDPATDEQKVALQTALGPVGREDAILVVTRIFAIGEMRLISVAEAASVLTAAAEPDFEADWRALADRLRKEPA